MASVFSAADAARAGRRPEGWGLLLLILALAALTKLLILAFDGPIITGDTAGYVSFADAILDHGRAFGPVAWGREAMPTFVFRMAGYPLVLAGAKLVAGAHWASLTILLQGAVDLLTTILIFRVMRRALDSAGAAALIVAAYLFLGSMLWDDMIMSDSLYASFFNITLFVLLGDLLGCWRSGLWGALGIGLLWGASILLRDDGVYFTILPLLLLAERARRDGGSWRRLAPPLGFAAVVAAFVLGYIAFNWQRTGEAFLGITGLANWLRPVFDMARLGYAHPFTGDDLISRTVRAVMTNYDFPAQEQFLVALHEQCRCTPTAMQSLVFHKALAEVARHPFAYLRVVLHSFNFMGLASDLYDPVATVNQFVQLGVPGGHRIVPGFSLHSILALARDFSLGDLALLLLSMVSAAVAGVLFALFLFGIPFLYLRVWRGREPLTRALAVAGFLWLVFMTISVAFSMVHYEARHALPVFPAGIAATVYVLCRLRASAGGEYLRG